MKGYGPVRSFADEAALKRHDERRGVRSAWIAPFALAHFVFERALFFASLGRGMRQFDRGEPPAAIDQLADVALQVLHFPLVSPLSELLPADLFTGLAGYLVFAANSALWGLALWLGIRAAARLRAPTRSETWNTP